MTQTNYPIEDPLDSFTRFIAESCIDSIDDSMETKEERIDEARSHIQPHLDHYSETLQVDIESIIEEMINNE